MASPDSARSHGDPLMARLTSKARFRPRKQRVRAQLEVGVLALNAPLADQSVAIWPVSSRRPPPGFYVYRLLDPRTGLVFYVGKGQRFRAWHHQRAAAAGRVHANTVVEAAAAAITSLIGRLEQADAIGDGAQLASIIGEVKASASALAAAIPANTPAASTSEDPALAETAGRPGRAGAAVIQLSASARAAAPGKRSVRPALNHLRPPRALGR